MKEAKIDVAVLMIFYNRADVLSKVFAEVKKARPSKLFLYQDGPRSDADIPRLQACRDVVADIDWDCEVHTFYQEKNFGCDPSEYIAQKWAFSFVDKCIVLEDDDVPSQSFFPFCKEMLDRYEHDNRVWMIAGFNPDEVTTDVDADYFFTEYMSIWGWATWRRVIDTWDADYSFLDDPVAMKRLKALVRQKNIKNDFILTCREHRATGREHYETLLWSSMLLNHGLSVMPTRNLVNNIGSSEDSTHFSTPPKMLPRGYRKMFTMKRHEIDFPLRHPKHIVENIDFKNRTYKTQGWNHPLLKVGRSFEELYLNLRYGNFKNISKAVKNRIRKTLRPFRKL